MMKKFLYSFGYIILFLVSAYFASPVFAAVEALGPTPIGSVIVAQGTVYAVNQANARRPLERKSSIYLNDKIVTGPNSKTQLRLADDSIIVLQADSEFFVSDFKFSKDNPGSNRYIGNVVKGALINISGLGEAKNYQLKSPLAVIAFRGTGVATKITGRGTAKEAQEIFVFQGEVSVTNICRGCDDRQLKRIDISALQKNNAALVSKVGVLTSISGINFSQLSIGRDKSVTKKLGGGMILQCKSKK